MVRPQLVIKEIYQAGVLSLIIVLMSGMFIGMVLALQGYETLVRFGATESMGVLVALSLVRELGPARANELILTCRRMPAIEAHAAGLINEVVPRPELEATVAARVAAISSPPSMIAAGDRRLSAYFIWAFMPDDPRYISARMPDERSSEASAA